MYMLLICRESIVLGNSSIGDHSLVIYSVIGKGTSGWHSLEQQLRLLWQSEILDAVKEATIPDWLALIECLSRTWRNSWKWKPSVFVYLWVSPPIQVGAVVLATGAGWRELQTTRTQTNRLPRWRTIHCSIVQVKTTAGKIRLHTLTPKELPHN